MKKYTKYIIISDIHVPCWFAYRWTNYSKL